MKFDIVGSFLPPENLVNAKIALTNGETQQEDYDAIASQAIKELIDKEIEAGLSYVTTGEFRRTYWDTDFYLGLNGIGTERLDSGHIYQKYETFTDLMRITGRIAYNENHPFFEDFTELFTYVDGRSICRQCIPSPADLYLKILNLSDGDLSSLYPSKETLLADITETYSQTIAKFYELGCRDIQFDDSACCKLTDPVYSKRLVLGGIDLNKLHDEIITLINDSLANVPADMNTSIYISNGPAILPEWNLANQPDCILPRLLKELNVNKYFLPFMPSDLSELQILAEIPSGKDVVLGLIMAHSPFPDKTDNIRNTIEIASTIIAPEHLLISPSTGFKMTDFITNGLTYADQWNKINQLATFASTI